MSTSATTVLQPDLGKIRRIERAYAVEQPLMTSESWAERLRLSVQRQFLRYHFIPPPMWKVWLRQVLPTPRMAPDFASLGAARSGTSLLSDYIMQHPCVVLCLGKESAVSDFPRKRELVAQFPSQRAGRQVERRYGKAICGFCSPVVPHLGFPYLWRAVTEKCKFILLLRNPVDRTFAHWRWHQAMFVPYTGEPLWDYFPEFGDIARREMREIENRGCVLDGLGYFSYVQPSIYPPFVRLMFEIFGKENFLVVNSSDFFADSLAVARQVYAFLELPDYEPKPMPVKNAGPRGVLDDKLRADLAAFFEPINQELYELIGKDFGW